MRNNSERQTDCLQAFIFPHQAVDIPPQPWLPVTAFSTGGIEKTAYFLGGIEAWAEQRIISRGPCSLEWQMQQNKVDSPPSKTGAAVFWEVSLPGPPLGPGLLLLGKCLHQKPRDRCPHLGQGCV